MRITYNYVDEIANDEEVWASSPVSLQDANPQQRTEIITCLLDQFRQNLAIDTQELNRIHHDELIRKSRSHLVEPWAIVDEDACLARARGLPSCERVPMARKKQPPAHYWKEQIRTVDGERTIAESAACRTARCHRGIMELLATQYLGTQDVESTEPIDLNNQLDLENWRWKTIQRCHSPYSSGRL